MLFAFLASGLLRAHHTGLFAVALCVVYIVLAAMTSPALKTRRRMVPLDPCQLVRDTGRPAPRPVRLAPTSLLAALLLGDVDVRGGPAAPWHGRRALRGPWVRGTGG